MNSNFRNYNGYIIKRTTIHTVNGACLPNYEIYKEDDVCFKNRLMCEEKLKDAKKWIDKQMNLFIWIGGSRHEIIVRRKEWK